jgi:hypothetical protein
MYHFVALGAMEFALRNLWRLDYVRGEIRAVSVVYGRRRAADLTGVAHADDEASGHHNYSKNQSLALCFKQRHDDFVLVMKLCLAFGGTSY